MTDLLDRSITESLAQMVAQTPPAGPMPIEPGLQHANDRRRRPWLLVAAAVVVLVGVGGIIAVTARPDPAPSASSQRPAGVFPYGGTAGAVAAGYPTPVDAVNAYLAEITDPYAPPGWLHGPRQVADPADRGDTRCRPRRGQHLAGDRRRLRRRACRCATRPADPDVWQVTSAEVISGELRDVRLADGSVSGSIAVAAAGRPCCTPTTWLPAACSTRPPSRPPQQQTPAPSPSRPVHAADRWGLPGRVALLEHGRPCRRLRLRRLRRPGRRRPRNRNGRDRSDVARAR